MMNKEEYDVELLFAGTSAGRMLKKLAGGIDASKKETRCDAEDVRISMGTLSYARLKRGGKTGRYPGRDEALVFTYPPWPKNSVSLLAVFTEQEELEAAMTGLLPAEAFCLQVAKSRAVATGGDVEDELLNVVATLFPGIEEWLAGEERLILDEAIAVPADKRGRGRL